MRGNCCSQVRDFVITVGVGRIFGGEVGLHVNDGDFRARHPRSGAIGDAAAYASERILRRTVGNRGDSENQRMQKPASHLAES
jgi:hypothetical protein